MSLRPLSPQKINVKSKEILPKQKLESFNPLKRQLNLIG